MQKAFVISSSSSGDHLPDHPAKYLDSSLNDIVGISNHKGSSGKVDTSSPAVLTGLGYDGTPFKMNKAEEMAALVSFFTSTSSNALPKIDPSKQLEPRKLKTSNHILLLLAYSLLCFSFRTCP